MRNLHYGQPGRDSMLATMSNVSWPRSHRELVGIANACQQRRVTGKNIKPLLRQNQIVKLPNFIEKNQEVAIDFAGPFKNINKDNKNLIVSNDHFIGWPEAKVIRKPDTDEVIAFLKEYIARHRIPQTIRTDPATIFKSNRFKEFCDKRYIKHVECPIGDHKGNGKTKRPYCTINERPRAKKEKQ